MRAPFAAPSNARSVLDVGIGSVTVLEVPEAPGPAEAEGMVIFSLAFTSEAVEVGFVVTTARFLSFLTESPSRVAVASDKGAVSAAVPSIFKVVDVVDVVVGMPATLCEV